MERNREERHLGIRAVRLGGILYWNVVPPHARHSDSETLR